MSNKKLLFVVTEDWYFYSHRLPMIKAAQEVGFDVSVITNINEYEFKDKINNLGVKIYELDFNRRSLNPFNALLCIFRLIILYRKIKPDIIHHIAMKPIVFGSFAAFFSPSSKIVNAFAGLGYVFSSKDKKATIIKSLLVFLFRFILKNNNRYILFQNPDDKEIFKKYNICVEERTKIIKGSGVDINKYHPIEKNDNENLIIIFAGRMIAIKGIDSLKKAFMILEEKKTKAELWLCGEPDKHNPESFNVDFLKDWDKKENVKWLGKQSNMADIWKKSDVGIQISYGGEGIPKSLLEAASCGNAIIASNSAGCKEVVIDGENGFIVEPYDVDAVVDCVIKMANNRQMVKNMGKKSRELVCKEFSDSYVTKQTKEFYKNILGS